VSNYSVLVTGCTGLAAEIAVATMVVYSGLATGWIGLSKEFEVRYCSADRLCEALKAFAGLKMDLHAQNSDNNSRLSPGGAQ
jgi:hypothetical protein